MQHFDERVRSHILIVDEVEEGLTRLSEQLQGERVVTYLREDFLIEDAKAAIAEAYISEERTKYLILGAKSFNTISQNSLLKVLEEPPRNIEFILIALSKAIFLPTIRSRLPMVQNISKRVAVEVDISLLSLDLDSMFRFVKANDRLKKHDAQELIEGIFHQAVVNEQLVLTPKQSNAFEKAYRLIGLNGRLQSILVMLLMTFLPESRRVS